MNQAAAMLNQAETGATRLERSAVLSVALWVFILIASTLFLLFLAAYVMRMRGADWSQFALPWQLQLSTGLLTAASISLYLACNMTANAKMVQARQLMWAGGTSMLAFLAVQYWAWQALLEMRITGTGNPAASFFYLLTAMHALHVLGGLLCWVLAIRFVLTSTDAAASTWRLRLCARYWHFLLLLWLILFTALRWITPELVAYICGPG